MLSPDNLITLPYTPDLTQAGIAYACQTLPDMASLAPKDIYARLRQTVIDQAAELAFRRHLSARNVPHKLGTSSYFTQANRACAVIGGRYCDVYSLGILRKDAIQQLQQNPTSLLSASAQVPVEDLLSEQRSQADLLVFAIITALVAPNLSGMKRAASAGQPLNLLYLLPAAWSRRSNWDNLGQLVLKSESNQPMSLTLVGQAEDRAFYAEEMNLPSLCRIEAQNIFTTLIYLQLTKIPSGRLGLHSPKLGRSLIVRPYDWGNIWVYGMQVYLAGWITRAEFQRCASPCPAGPSGWQTGSAGNKFLAMPVSDLRSLDELFSRAIDWDGR
jgi:hypothetical protein